jgi:hypothetical protein
MRHAPSDDRECCDDQTGFLRLLLGRPMLDATSPTRELSMPRVLGFHEVKDVQQWVSSPQREEFFGPLGVTDIKTYVDPQGSKRVAITMNVPDMDALMSAMQTPGAAAAMEHDGVIAETLVILVES